MRVAPVTATRGAQGASIFIVDVGPGVGANVRDDPVAYLSERCSPAGPQSIGPKKMGVGFRA